MQQSRRCELCVLAATVPDCSRQLKLHFAVCTVADFLSISFRLQSSKMVMSSNVIFELQLVIVCPVGPLLAGEPLTQNLGQAESSFMSRYE